MENNDHQKELCCTLNAAELHQRKKTLQAVNLLVQSKREVPNGYIFEFDGSNETLEAVLNIVRLERKCCRFLSFNLKIEEENRPLFLEITGPEGTKEFLLHELGF